MNVDFFGETVNPVIKKEKGGNKNEMTLKWRVIEILFSADLYKERGHFERRKAYEDTG